MVGQNKEKHRGAPFWDVWGFSICCQTFVEWYRFLTQALLSLIQAALDRQQPPLRTPATAEHVLFEMGFFHSPTSAKAVKALKFYVFLVLWTALKEGSSSL